jgi:hypothetical protein
LGRRSFDGIKGRRANNQDTHFSLEFRITMLEFRK